MPKKGRGRGKRSQGQPQQREEQAHGSADVGTRVPERISAEGRGQVQSPFTPQEPSDPFPPLGSADVRTRTQERIPGAGRGQIRRVTPLEPPEHAYPPSSAATGARTKERIPDERREQRRDYPPLRSETQDVTSTVTAVSKLSVGDEQQLQVVRQIPDIEKPSASASKEPSSIQTGSKLERARRPAYNPPARRQIRLISNLFQLKCNKDCFYHYDVDIIPLDTRPGKKASDSVEQKLPGKELCHQIIFKLTEMQKSLGDFKPIYDGKKNLFTCQPMPIKDEQEFETPVLINGRERRFLVCIKPVVKKQTNTNRIELKSLQDYVSKRSTGIPNEVRMVFDAILAYRPPHFKQINVRNAFFFTEVEGRLPLGDGCELWLGYNQTVRFTEKGAAVVINVAAAAFHASGPVLKIVSDLLYNKPLDGNSSMDPRSVRKFESLLKNLRVEVTHQKFKRKYYVQGIAESARKQLFEISVNGQTKQISVEKYFLDAYKKRLQYPHLPCLHMKASKGKVYIPIEVCDIISGQRVQGKLDGKKTAKMIKGAAIPPFERFDKIKENANTICKISSCYMKEYGLQMSLEPIRVTAKILDQPKISYPRQNELPNEKGVWNIRSQFSKSASVTSNSTLQGILISFAPESYCSYKQLAFFTNLLCRTSSKYGLSINVQDIRICSGREKTANIFQNALNPKASNNFIIFVLCENDSYHSYEEIKFFGDIKYSIVTQCVDSELVIGRKMNEIVATNICLKLNTKLGGTNHILSEWPMALARERVILFGADVVHSVGSRCPSIAAVVGSLDYSMCKYAVSCRAQRNPRNSGRSQEIIIDLKEMVVSLLRAYYRNTKMKPQKILFYRDGVSEGQFQHVLEQEIPMIKDACRSLEEGYMPPITFVIVQKRHPVRFRPERKQDGIGRGGNVPPGSTVDTDVVDPVNYDFYLCSHEGIQGTSKPTYYTVLFDENRVQIDVMENLTFYLCYVFARCNRSISIPAPVKYADLLAYRANHYVQQQLKSSTQQSYDLADDVPEDIKRLVKSIDAIEARMFFV